MSLETEEIDKFSSSATTMVSTNILGKVENIYKVGIGNIYNIEGNSNVGDGKGEVNNSYYICLLYTSFRNSKYNSTNYCTILNKYTNKL